MGREIKTLIANLITMCIPIASCRRKLRNKSKVKLRKTKISIAPDTTPIKVNLDFTHKVDRILNIIKQISSDPKQDIVYIFQHQFFDTTGTKYYSGGAERYCCDLSNIFHEVGLKTVLIQVGTSNGEIWKNQKENLHIIGLNCSFEEYNEFLAKLPTPKLAVYSGVALWGTAQQIHKPSILISHGVTWDTPTVFNLQPDTLKGVLYAFDNIISVDTNTISNLRTQFAYELSINPKYMLCIYNYVDNSIFKPKVKESKRIKITFPRRLCSERGFWIFTQIVSCLLEKYDNIDIEFIGFIHDSKIEKNLYDLKTKYSNRITHGLVDADKMSEVYQNTDISVIPTLYAEGTSLSCLEAMACGNAVIATNIGGLPNLIIDGYNGLLVNPDSAELYNAICRLIDNDGLRNTIAANAVNVAKTFDKTIWCEKWKSAIYKICPDLKDKFTFKDLFRIQQKSCATFFIYVSTFPYSGSLRQRPHHMLKQFSRHNYITLWSHENLPKHISKIDENFYLIDNTLLTDILNCGADYIIDVYAHHPLSKLQEEFINKSSSKQMIVEYIDDFNILENNPEVREFLQKKLREYATNPQTLFLASAKSLYAELTDEYQIAKDQIILSKNAVNPEDFQKKIDCVPQIMEKIISKNKPIIGYYGALCDDWFDYDLCSKILNDNPQWELVFIGPISGTHINKISAYSNFTYIPTVIYDDLPKYASCFDIGIIPFKVNDISKATSPVKLFEYMAMKLPTVTTFLPECLEFQSVLVSMNAKEFETNIREALKLKNSVTFNKIIDADLQHNTWQNRVNDIIDRLKSN